MPNNFGSCREKIYSADGDVSFGKVYDPTDVSQKQHQQQQQQLSQDTADTAFICDAAAVCTSPSTIRVFLSMYTALKAVNKSPQSKDNRNKICNKGKTLYVLGVVAGPDTKEYFMFSEETYVFKRMWCKVKDLVVAAGHTVVEADVIGTGEVKNKWEVPKRSRRKITKTSAFQVQFTNSPLSAVWFTPYGLQHMASLNTVAPSSALPCAGCGVLKESRSEAKRDGTKADDSPEAEAEAKTSGEGEGEDNEKKACHQTLPDCAEDKGIICCTGADSIDEGSSSMQSGMEGEGLVPLCGVYPMYCESALCGSAFMTLAPYGGCEGLWEFPYV